MTQRYVVPSIYQDISNQAQGYFAFRTSGDDRPLLPRMRHKITNGNLRDDLSRAPIIRRN